MQCTALQKLHIAVLAISALLAVVAPSAFASHQQGGFFTAEITPDGRLQGSLVYLEQGGCTVGGSASNSFTLTNPVGTSTSISTSGTWTRCLSSSATSRTYFDVDLADFGSALDGAYTLEFNSCCRVSPIVNILSSGTLFRARVTKVDGQATGAPNLSSDVALGVAKGFAYDQNLNATDPDGGPLTYASAVGEADGPSSDLVAFGPTGSVTVDAATTSTLNHGDRYVYKVRVTDDEGDYTERDVLLTVTGDNAPPEITGLDTSTPYIVEAGAEQSIAFSAADPNSAAPKIDTVSISAAGLPAWATIETTPGNPANATLKLQPPANAPAQTITLNIDAADDDSMASLIDSSTIQITVVPDTTAPAMPSLTLAPASVSTATLFGFLGEAGATFSCSVDGSAWAPCTSQHDAAGLADGSHTFRVRATDAAGNVSVAAEHSWLLDRAAAAPAIVGGPVNTVTATDAQFDFTGEPGAAFECQLDGAGWVPCSSPLIRSGFAIGSHSLDVRQTDLAGNVSPVATRMWTVAEVPPVAESPAALEPVVGTEIAVDQGTAQVGCMITGGSLESCSVRVYARVPKPGGGTRLVYIGRGSVSFDAAGTANAAITVRLTRRGKKLVNRVGGVKVRFDINAKPIGADPLKAKRNARLLPDHLLVIPSNGLFDSDSAKLLSAGREYLLKASKRLSGVKSVLCTGHTDSWGARSYNRRLGLRRARAVCAELRSLGLTKKIKARSKGEASPRSTNRTENGRALNRRVELKLRFR